MAGKTLPVVMNLAALRDAVHRAEQINTDAIDIDDIQNAIVAVYYAIGFTQQEALTLFQQSVDRVGDQFTRAAEEALRGR